MLRTFQKGERGGADKAIILLYHCVGNTRTDPWSLFVSPRKFRAQMTRLKREASVISLDALALCLENGRFPERAVVITFDDGYANNLVTALPVLSELDLPATFFIATGRINAGWETWSDELDGILLRPRGFGSVFSSAGSSRASRQRMYGLIYNILRTRPDAERTAVLEPLQAWTDAPLQTRETHRALTTEELRLLIESPLVTLGSHTVNHPVLASLPLPAQRAEIAEANTWLHSSFGLTISHFAYPYGGATDFTDQTAKIVNDLGLRTACTSAPRNVTTTTSPFLLPRRHVGNLGSGNFAAWLDRGFAS